MAKRQAEDQLTKDDFERGDRDDGEEEGSNAPATASAEALAARPIRGLPKSKSRTPAPAANPAPVNPFGAPPATSAPSSSALPKPSPFGAISFGAPPASSSNPSATPATPSFFFGVSSASSPSIAPPASTPAPGPPKPFAGFSFGGGSAIPAASAPPVASNPFGAPSSGASSLFGSDSAAKKTIPSSIFTPATLTSQPSKDTTKPAPPISNPNPFGAAPKPISSIFASTPAASLTPKPVEPTPSLPPAPKPAFAGFSFTVPTPSSTPISSTSTTSKVDPTKPADAVSAFKAVTSGLKFDVGAAGTAFAPVLSSSVGQTPTAVAAPAAPAAPEKSKDVAPATVSDSNREDKVAQQKAYLISVRGLNESLLRAILAKMKTSPFVDFRDAFDPLKEEYGKHLVGIMKEAGIEDKGESSGTGKNVGSGERMDVDTEKVTESKQIAPPKVNQGFMLAPLPSSSSTPSSGGSAGGFKPSQPIPSSGGFSFGSFGKPPATSSSETPSAPKLADDESMSQDSPAPVVKANVRKPESGASKLVQSIIKDSDEEAKKAATENESSLLLTSTNRIPSGRKRAASPGPDTPPSKRQSAIFAIKPTVKPSIGSEMVLGSSGSGESPVVFKAPAPAIKPFHFGSGTAPPSPGPSGFSFASTSSPARPRLSTGFSFGSTAAAESAATTPSGSNTETPVEAKVSNMSSLFPSSSGLIPKPPPLAANGSFAFSSPTSFPSAPAFSSTSSAAPATTAFGSSSSTAQPFGSSSTNPFAAPVKTDTPASTANADDGSDIRGMQTGVGEEDETDVWAQELRCNSNEPEVGWGPWVPYMVKIKREVPQEGQATDSKDLARRFLARALTASGEVRYNVSFKNIKKAFIKPKNIFSLMTVGKNAAGSPILREIHLSFGGKPEAAEKLAGLIQAFKGELASAGMSDMGL